MSIQKKRLRLSDQLRPLFLAVSNTYPIRPPLSPSNNGYKTAHKRAGYSCTANPSQRAAFNPLLSCWFSIASQKFDPDDSRLTSQALVCSRRAAYATKTQRTRLPSNRKQKIWRVWAPSIAKPRPARGDLWQASAQTIMGNCATRLIFAEHDPEIAERISRSLGESEIKEYQEGISYGAHQVRDGVSLSLQSKKIPTVSPTEIQSLENNYAYIKLPGNVPISKIYLKLK